MELHQPYSAVMQQPTLLFNSRIIPKINKRCSLFDLLDI